MLLDYSFDISVVIVLIISTLSQCIFGVGILLWGTPSLLLLGYNYPDALSILLPISISISILQFVPNAKHIDRGNILSFAFIALPIMVISFALILEFVIDVNSMVVIALSLAGLLRTKWFAKTNQRMKKSKNALLPLLGLVHGVSNLGGSILVIWSSYSTATKLGQRTLVAVAYTALASFQLVLLHVNKGFVNLPMFYLLLCFGVYLLGSSYLFSKINDTMFANMLTILIFAMAALLFLSNL